MRTYGLLFAIGCICTTVFAHVNDSIIPMMDRVSTQDFNGKVNVKQRELMEMVRDRQSDKLRIMTYNMLFNAPWAEKELPTEHLWEYRKPRLQEYLSWAQVDIIGSQELQEDQCDAVMEALGDHYDFYGQRIRAEENRSDSDAIFFRKDRFTLLNGNTYNYINTGNSNAFTYCHLYDKTQQQEFIVINTHLSFINIDRRYQEACQLRDFVKTLSQEIPVIVLGDFNTFPFCQDKRNLFFDGDHIINLIENAFLKEARCQAIFGHFGPLCSVNYCPIREQAFVGPELQGLILDHIFINDQVEIIAHGIDTAKVDGNYASDHLPVIADIVFRKN